MEKKIILKEKNFSRLKHLVKENKEKTIIFTSDDDELNRKVCEKLPIQILLIPLDRRKDYMKQRNSGMNEVLMKILKKNKIKLGFDIDELIESKNKAFLLSRLRQNIFLANKGKIEFVLVRNRDKRDIRGIKSILELLGIHNSLIKNL